MYKKKTDLFLVQKWRMSEEEKATKGEDWKNKLFHQI